MTEVKPYILKDDGRFYVNPDFLKTLKLAPEGDAENPDDSLPEDADDE